MKFLSPLRTEFFPSLSASLFKGWAFVFWISFLILGSLFTFFIPPFQLPDENAHWYAAYERYERFMSDKDEPALYCNYANGLPEHFRTGPIAFHPHEKIDGEQYRTIKEQKPVCLKSNLTYGYLGTYPGLVASRIVVKKENARGERSFQVFLLARLFQGLMVAAALARLLHLCVKQKVFFPGILTFCAAIICPMTIQQSFGVTADSIIFALSIYLVSAILFWRSLTIFDWLVIAYLSFSMGLTKPPSIGVIPGALLAGWLIAQTKDVSKNLDLKRLVAAVAITISAIASAAWITFQDHTLPDYQILGRDINLGRQLHFMLAHPWSSFVMLHKTIMGYTHIPALIEPLGWLDTPLREWTRGYWWWVVSLALGADCILLLSNLLAKNPESETITAQRKWIQVGSFLMYLATSYISALLIALTLYLTWTTVTSPVVHGLQGRYFLPLMLSVPIVVGGILSSLHGNTQSKIVAPAGTKTSFVTTVVSVASAVILLSFILLYTSSVFTDLVRRWW